MAVTSSEGWLGLFDSTNKLSDDIQSDINERNRILRNNGSTSMLNSQLRRRLGELTNAIGQLNDSLGKINITDKENHRRRDLLANLSNKKEYLNTLMKNPGRDGSSLMERGDLFGGKGSPQVSGKTQWSMSNESEQTKNLGNVEILQLQRNVMQNQDSNLESLHASITKQKQMGLAISDELDLQSHLLDDLDTAVDGTQARIRGNQRRMKKVFLGAKGTTGIVVIVILAGIFILLAATDWGRAL